MKPKYVRVVSDTHIEQFREQQTEALVANFVGADKRDKDSILILAGDISSQPLKLLEFVKFLEPRFIKVFFLPGNHEYYRHNYEEWNKLLSKKFEELMPNVEAAIGKIECFEGEGYRVIFGTMWADGGPWEFQQKVQQYMNDFRVITKMRGDQQFTFSVQDMMQLHFEQRDQLVGFLKTPFDGQTIVATHHMPSYKLCAPRFQNIVNGGFAANMDDFIRDYAPDFWIAGHTHDTIDRKLWKTRIVINPAGYAHEYNSYHNQFSSKFLKLNG